MEKQKISVVNSDFFAYTLSLRKELESFEGVINMKRIVWLLLIGFLVVSCAEDIIVKPPSELRGNYKGSYWIETNVGSSGGSKTRWQWIDWTFTDIKFFCEATDTTLRDRITCDFDGFYTVENVMIFSDTTVKPGTCDHDDIPVGEFDYITKSGEGNPDTLIFTQSYGSEYDMTIKTIKLVKLEE
jgi:hypothetical protein